MQGKGEETRTRIGVGNPSALGTSDASRSFGYFYYLFCALSVCIFHRFLPLWTILTFKYATITILRTTAVHFIILRRNTSCDRKIQRDDFTSGLGLALGPGVQASAAGRPGPPASPPLPPNPNPSSLPWSRARRQGGLGVTAAGAHPPSPGAAGPSTLLKMKGRESLRAEKRRGRAGQGREPMRATPPMMSRGSWGKAEAE